MYLQTLLNVEEQLGSTLIEVLIALSLLSFGLLSYVRLQTVALQNTRYAYYQSIAQLHANSILASLRADPLETRRAVAIHTWQADLRRDLPGGVGDITCSTAACSITVAWHDVGGDTHCPQFTSTHNCITMSASL